MFLKCVQVLLCLILLDINPFKNATEFIASFVIMYLLNHWIPEIQHSKMLKSKKALFCSYKSPLFCTLLLSLMCSFLWVAGLWLQDRTPQKRFILPQMWTLAGGFSCQILWVGGIRVEACWAGSTVTFRHVDYRVVLTPEPLNMMQLPHSFWDIHSQHPYNYPIL